MATVVSMFLSHYVTKKIAKQTYTKTINLSYFALQTV